MDVYVYVYVYSILRWTDHSSKESYRLS
jgi:hypothetical protein